MLETKYSKYSLLEALEEILKLTTVEKKIQFRQIMEILAHRGSAALLVIFSLLFCIPIQIPGFSTPFGILLGFLGLRIAFGKKPWFPKWIMEKSIDSHFISQLVQKTIHTVQLIQKIIHPRLLLLTHHPFFQAVNGLIVFFLSILLSLPLPIPFTNMLSALPILFIGLGLLENDGIFIICGYILAVLNIIFFYGILIFGYGYIKGLFI